MAFTFDQASIITEGYCLSIDEITNNPETFRNFQSERKSNVFDSFEFLYPCYYEDGNFSVSSDIFHEEKAAREVITNFYTYLDMMD